MKNFETIYMLFFIPILSLLLSSCNNEVQQTYNDVEENPITKELGKQNIDLILKTIQTTVYCLNPYETKPTQKFMEFPVINKIEKIDGTDLELLKIALLNKENYDLKGPNNKCMFTPTIAFNFKNDLGKEFTALICFRCNEWRMVGANKQQFSFNGAPGHDEMVKIADSFCTNATVEATDTPAVPISLPDEPAENDKPDAPAPTPTPTPSPSPDIAEQPVSPPTNPTSTIENPSVDPTTTDVTNFTDRPENTAAMTISAPVKKFFGEEKMKVIEKSSKVTLYYLQPFSTDANLKKLGNYPILKQTEISAKQSKKLQQILVDEKNYYFDDTQKMCLFTPELAAELENENGEKMRALFSFRCNEWKFEMNGKRIIEDTETGYDVLANFAKTVFPDFKLEE